MTIHQVVNEGSGAYIKRTAPLQPMNPKVHLPMGARLGRWLSTRAPGGSSTSHTHRADNPDDQER